MMNSLNNFQQRWVNYWKRLEQSSGVGISSTNVLDVIYECIQQVEEKDKQEEDTKEVASEEATQEEGKQVFLSKEDETTLIGNLIRKQEIVVDPINKGKPKEHKVETRMGIFKIKDHKRTITHEKLLDIYNFQG